MCCWEKRGMKGKTAALSGRVYATDQGMRYAITPKTDHAVVATTQCLTNIRGSLILGKTFALLGS
jgi:hypothetical protein